MKVNHSKEYYPFDIKACEKHYNAKYIGDFQTKRKDNSWNDKPCAIFYVENPDITKGHNHYFGLYLEVESIDPFKWGEMFICEGMSAIEEPFTAIQADNEEYIISSYKHDYRVSNDKSVFIDGGRNYIRCTSDKKLVKLKLNKDKFEISND